MADKLTVREASQLSGYSTDWIRILCQKGEIAFERFGRSYAIDKKSLLKYVADHPQPQAEQPKTG
jgi:excisionase family DNA binding protein